jgi:hypothetical protein
MNIFIKEKVWRSLAAEWRWPWLQNTAAPWLSARACWSCAYLTLRSYVFDAIFSYGTIEVRGLISHVWVLEDGVVSEWVRDDESSPSTFSNGACLLQLSARDAVGQNGCGTTQRCSTNGWMGAGRVVVAWRQWGTVARASGARRSQNKGWARLFIGVRGSKAKEGHKAYLEWNRRSMPSLLRITVNNSSRILSIVTPH